MNIKSDNKKSKNSFLDKRNGRIIALQSLFVYDFSSNNGIDEILKFDWLNKEEYSNESFEYAIYLITGTIKNIELIDSIIRSKLKNWDFQRIASVDKAILRFSIFSILFEKDLSKKIIINEAIELSKIFGSEDSYRFVNGILDAIREFEKKD